MINHGNSDQDTQERVAVKNKEKQRNRRSKKGQNTVKLISKDGTSQTWVRIDFGKCFVTARDPMPPWKYVVRRVTDDLETRNIVEDLWACESMSVMVHRQLPPEVKGTETWFYYEMGDTVSSSRGNDSVSQP